MTTTTNRELLTRQQATVVAHRRSRVKAGAASLASTATSATSAASAASAAWAGSAASPASAASATFLLQRVQPAMTGLIDGSLSTLAPIFAIALATRQPHYAFLAGLATAIGAGVSMAFSEGLSDTGDLTGRGNPLRRGLITGAGTFVGGILHTLPFLIPQYRAALLVAAATVAFELLTLAWIRWRLFHTGFLSSFASVALGGAIIAGISTLLGVAAA